MPVYDKTYIKAKVREFGSNKVPKGNMYYTCIACMTIDTVMKMVKSSSHFYSYFKKKKKNTITQVLAMVLKSFLIENLIKKFL